MVSLERRFAKRKPSGNKSVHGGGLHPPCLSKAVIRDVGMADKIRRHSCSAFRFFDTPIPCRTVRMFGDGIEGGDGSAFETDVSRCGVAEEDVVLDAVVGVL